MKLRCPACRIKLKAKAVLVGKKVKCPGCQVVFRLMAGSLTAVVLPVKCGLLTRFMNRSRN